MFYDLESNDWNEEEMKALLKVLRANAFSMGELVGQFEGLVANKTGKAYGVMVNSGAAANLLAVAGLFFKKDRPLRKGDEVIVPALGLTTTYLPLQQFGLKLKAVDVDLETLNIDTLKLDKALTHRTRMVVGINMLGNPAQLENLKAFCKRHNLYLWEDNSQGAGGELRSKKTGFYGDVSTFSFNFGSQISTIEGGMLLTDDKDIYHVARCLRNQGSAKGLPEECSFFERKAEDFSGSDRLVLPGYNFKPWEMLGAIGLEQFKKLESSLEVRRQNAVMLAELFKGDNRFILQKEYGKSAWYSFSIIIHPNASGDRGRVLDALTGAGIAAGRIGCGNIFRHDLVKQMEIEPAGELINANLVHDRGFCVGNHAGDLMKQMEKLHKVLTTAVGAPIPSAFKKPGYPNAA